jgi:hypothetical protein
VICADKAATVPRRGGHAGHRRSARARGRRPDHGLPAGRRAQADDQRLPGGRRGGQAARPAGPPLLRPRRCDRFGTGSRAVADGRLREPGRSGSYPPISSFAFLSDTHTAALVGPDAAVEWLCVPRFDAPSVFARLLDRERGGAFEVRVTDAGTPERRYLPGTLVLESRFEASGRPARRVRLLRARSGGRQGSRRPPPRARACADAPLRSRRGTGPPASRGAARLRARGAPLARPGRGGGPRRSGLSAAALRRPGAPVRRRHARGGAPAPSRRARRGGARIQRAGAVVA